MACSWWVVMFKRASRLAATPEATYDVALSAVGSPTAVNGIPVANSASNKLASWKRANHGHSLASPAIPERTTSSRTVPWNRSADSTRT